MRLKTDIFVSAILRRVFGQGGFAAIERKGAEEAGAIFIRQRHRDGLETLYVPAPQTSFEDDHPADRLFEIRLERAGREDVEALLAREIRFDPDLWLVEVEADEISDLVSLAAG